MSVSCHERAQMKTNLESQNCPQLKIFMKLRSWKVNSL